jgi:capsular exopolysaccharide synthesis family protein
MNLETRNSNNTESVALVPIGDGPYADRQGRYVSTARYGFEASETNDEAKGILDYWRTVVRNWKMVIICAVAGLALGLAAGIPMKPVYRAEVSLEVLTMNQDFMNIKQASPTSETGNPLESSDQVTQAKLLQSKTLLKRVLAKLDPDGAFAGKSVQPVLATQGWRSWFHLKAPVPLTPHEVLLNAAANTLKVKETPHAKILELTVDSTDAELAAIFANTLTHEFIAQNAEERGAASDSTSKWLRGELDDTRNKLRASEDALQAYASSSGIILTDENTNVVTEKLQQVQQELSNASADRITKESRLDLARKSPPNALADVLNDATLRDTDAKINDLKRQIADLRAVYSPTYSKVRRLQAELDSSQAAYIQQRADILSRIDTDFQGASQKERLLASSYDKQTREVTNQSEKSIQYNILKREVDSNRQLYDTMLQQTKQSSLAAALRASNVRVVDAADVPDVPYSPNFKINAVVGMLGGMFFSIVTILLRDQADRTLKEPGEITALVELPELGVIPSTLFELPSAPGGVLALNRYPRGITLEIQERKRVTSKLLKPWMDGPSIIADAFRSVLTSIEFGTEKGNRPQVLVFTSVNPSEGKSTAVYNLAVASAEIGHKVLIIDADLRRPCMHEMLQMDNDRGLSDLHLAADENSDFNTLIQQTSIANVDVLTAGPMTSSAVHLLHSKRFEFLLKLCRQEYDAVLIDTPPMTNMTDARVVGRLADGVVLIARVGVTSRDALLAAKARLQSDNIPIIGSILNDWNPKQSSGSYRNYRSNSGPYSEYSR